MKVLMYGFGSGNNIEPWLEFFERYPDRFRLTFVCRGFRFDQERFKNIEVLDISRKGYTGVFFPLTGRRYDTVYIQGLYDYLHISFLFFFVRSRLKVLNIWNNHNYKKAGRQNKKFWQRPFYHYILRKANRIYFTWHGTYTDFSEYFPGYSNKLYIKPWGIREKIMEQDPAATSKIAIRYLRELPPESLFLFWPENISPDEHIDKVLQAVAGISDRSHFRILIFSGHAGADSPYRQKLQKIIEENHLEGQVRLMTGNYLPYQDIMAFWKRADLSIKLSTKDQLSNGIIEGLYFGTPLILNNWLPYQKLAETGIHLFLCELNVEDIRSHLENLLQALRHDRLFFNQQAAENREMVKQFFNFDRNIGELMEEIKGCIT